jgi:hypothetical protein
MIQEYFSIRMINRLVDITKNLKQIQIISALK